MTPTTQLARMVAFELEFARRQATRVLAVPGGFAVRHADFPVSHNNNRLLVTSAADPAELLDAADSVLSDVPHRMVTVYDDDLGAAFAGAAVAAGYEHIPLVAMAHAGDDPPAPAVPVEALDLATLIPSLRRDWRLALPTVPEDTIDQLARRVAVRLTGADEVRFLGVVGDSGHVLARTDLYLEDGIGQIENVMTSPEHRGQGYGRAVVREALRRARAAGCELIYLVADESDWPAQWYGRLGFSTVGRVHEFIREPAV
ncbi:GNAT family N-acetyltransferase [Solihabitans fulvus]|uniref:GNAT family N-acetyltransferase n=1 Tax=Solihabitans fulvus TaxID=1892852 RepID=A0A5B2XCR2_9PSEU|nr:GNAT family N-acetyltransferase [Solihabitans fulvus]KAA2261093.1 GNAT family N-acetyltransferase [Solihabitans fulvus]